MSYTLDSVPGTTTSRTILIRGTRPSGKILNVEAGGVEFTVTYPDLTSFESLVQLSGGPNEITVRNDGREVLSASVTLKPLEGGARKIETALDQHGVEHTTLRHPGERSIEYRNWMLAAQSSYRRGPSARGLRHAALVESRTVKSPVVWVESSRQFQVVVRSGRLEFRSASYEKTDRLEKGWYENQTGEVVEDLNSPSGEYQWLPDGSFEVTRSGIFTWRYVIMVKTSGALSEVEVENLRFVYPPSLRNSRVSELVPGLYNAVWTGDRWRVMLEHAPLTVWCPAEPGAVESMGGDLPPGTRGTLVESLRSLTADALPYLYGSAGDSLLFADDLNIDKSRGVVPHFDVPLPENSVVWSGTRSDRQLIPSSEGMKVRVRRGPVWVGEELWYLFGKKRALPLTRMAQVRFNLSEVQFLKEDGDSVSSVPGDLTGSGKQSWPGDWRITAGWVDGVEISPTDLVREGETILVKAPDKGMRPDSLIKLAVSYRGETYLRILPVSQGTVSFALPADYTGGQVILTDESVSKPDSSYSKTRIESKGEFRLE